MISQIFEAATVADSGNGWWDDEVVLWISNYQPGKLTMLTNRHVWHLEYALFKVDKESKRLSYPTLKQTPQSPLKYTNYLIKALENAYIIPEKETKSRPTASPPSTTSTASYPWKPPTEGPVPPNPDDDQTSVTSKKRTRPVPPEEEETTQSEEQSTRERRSKLMKSLIILIVLVGIVILILLVVLAFVYRKKREALLAFKASGPEGGQAKSTSKEKVKSASKEKVKSASKEQVKSPAKSKTPSSRSIRSPSKEKAKTGSQISLKSNKSVSQLKSIKSLSQLKKTKSTGLPMGKGK